MANKTAYATYDGMEAEYDVRMRDLNAWMDSLVEDGTFGDRDDALEVLYQDVKEHLWPAVPTSADRMLLDIAATAVREGWTEQQAIDRYVSFAYPFPTRRAKESARQRLCLGIDQIGICANAQMHGWEKELELWRGAPEDQVEYRPSLARRFFAAACEWIDRRMEQKECEAKKVTAADRFGRTASPTHCTPSGDVQVSSYDYTNSDGKNVHVRSHSRRRPRR